MASGDYRSQKCAEGGRLNPQSPAPLGRGFLTGKIRDIDSLDEDDYRRYDESGMASVNR